MINKKSWMCALGLLLCLGLLMGLPACGGCDTTSVGVTSSGSIVVSPSTVAFPQVSVGSQREEYVFVRNVSTAPLSLLEVVLKPREGSSLDDFELVDLPSFSKDKPYVLEGNGTLEFAVRYTPSSPKGSFAQLIISSSDPSKPEATLDINTLDSLPELVFLPSSPLRFAKRPVGSQEVRDVLIRNNGKSDLVIHEAPIYTGGADFKAGWPTTGYPRTLKPYDAQNARINPDVYELKLPVNYMPIGGDDSAGEVTVFSNDVSRPDPEDGAQGIAVYKIQASSDAPCILVDSVARNFGQVALGKSAVDVVTIENCGNKPLVLQDISIAENSSDDEYELDLLGSDANNDMVLDLSVELAPTKTHTFAVKYIPAEEGTDMGKVIISSNDPVTPQLELTLVARGAIGQCPEAIAGGYIKGGGASPRDMLAAVPLQTIVLDGSTSSDDGFIPNTEGSWEWFFMEKPGDAAVSLAPLPEEPDNFKKRSFRLLLAGDYKIGLRVRDNDNFESCNTAEVLVRAVPNEKILIELTWINPEDPDTLDDLGDDLDLHLVKMGPGQWFESPYDIYFRNSNGGPDGSNNGVWNPESPSLDIDDYDGFGPENIQMNDPNNCEWYAVGVHYYKQTYGTAYATVRIYIDSKLVFEEPNRPMQRGNEFWDVARVHWDSGQVQFVDDLLPAAPVGLKPTVTDSAYGDVNMANSGLCTTQGLY